MVLRGIISGNPATGLVHLLLNPVEDRGFIVADNKTMAFAEARTKTFRWTNACAVPLPR
jgi:hypothetical protein